MDYMLGKLPAKFDKRTLCVSDYIMELPKAPASHAWSGKVSDWGMMLNDTIGDCAVCGPGHMIQCWSANESSQITPTDAQILKAYSAISGYNPVTHANDNGCNMLDVLKYWQKKGIASQKILAYASVPPSNLDHVHAAMYLFGGIDIGLELPISAQKQIGKTWDVPRGGATGNGEPGSWGGHCVTIYDYDGNGKFVCCTWGQLQKMTAKFLQTYCDNEAFAVVSKLWVSRGKCPSGFDLGQLLADVKTL